MLGLINNGIKSFVTDTWGEAAWAAVVQAAGVDHGFVSSCPYADAVSVSILATVAEQHGMDLGDVLEAAGYHFNTSFIQRMGYDRLLRCMGGNLVEFLQNLNVYHLHLSMTFKELQPPAFNVSEVTPDSLVFRYASTRPGLTRFAVGLLRGAARTLYGKEVTVSIIGLRSDGSDGSEPCDHDRLLVRFPEPEPSVLEQHSAAHTCRLGIDPPSLFSLFPFHMVLDSSCRLLQVGRALSRMYPGMKPGRLLSDFFSIRHPYVDMNFDRITERTDSTFILRSRLNGMEIKGQMQPMSVPKAERGLCSAASSTAAGLEGGRPYLFGAPPVQTPLTTSAPIPGAAPAPAATGRRMHSQLPLDSPAAAPAPAAVAAPTSGAMPRCPFHAAPGHGTAAPASSLPHPPAWNPHQQPQGHARPGAAGAGRVASAAATEERERLEPQGLGGAEAEGQPSYNQSHIALGDVDDATAAGATAAVAALPPMAYMQSKGVWGGGSCPSLPTLALSQPVAQQQEPVMLFLGTPRIGSVDELRTYGLFVSDLPLFDNSREMVLMAEQHTAEAALKDTFERLSLQLEEERRRSDALLYQMIPPHVADTLRRGERAEAETYPEATILFSDVVGFTTIAAGSTAMEVCRMLDALYLEFDSLLELEKYQSLYKVETIGDAYMLVANVTKPCHDHVDIMLDFALDMHRVCSRVRTNRGQPIEIRIGIHSGSVVGGVVGRRMPRFTLFGDTVNTASRMESHGVPGSVHMSGASRALLRDPSQYLLTERGEIAVKGKGLMETFLVSRASAPTASHLMSLLAAASASNDPDYHNGGHTHSHSESQHLQLPAALQVALASILGNHPAQPPPRAAGGRAAGGHSDSGPRAARRWTGPDTSNPGSTPNADEAALPDSEVLHKSESVLLDSRLGVHLNSTRQQQQHPDHEEAAGEGAAAGTGHGGFGSMLLPVADDAPATSLGEGVEGFLDDEREPRAVAATGAGGARLGPAHSNIRPPLHSSPRPQPQPQPQPQHTGLSRDEAILDSWIADLSLADSAAPSSPPPSAHSAASSPAGDAVHGVNAGIQARSAPPSALVPSSVPHTSAGGAGAASGARAASVLVQPSDGKAAVSAPRAVADAAAVPFSSAHGNRPDGDADGRSYRARSLGSSRPHRHARVGRLRQPSFILHAPPATVAGSLPELDFSNAELQLLELIHELQEQSESGCGAEPQRPAQPSTAGQLQGTTTPAQAQCDLYACFGAGGGVDTGPASATARVASPQQHAATRQRPFASASPAPRARTHHQRHPSSFSSQHMPQLQALLGLLRASNSSAHSHGATTAESGSASSRRCSYDGNNNNNGGGQRPGRRAGSGAVHYAGGCSTGEALQGPHQQASPLGLAPVQGSVPRGMGRTRSWCAGRPRGGPQEPQDAGLLTSHRVAAAAIDERGEGEVSGGLLRQRPAGGGFAGQDGLLDSYTACWDNAEEEEEQDYVPRHRLTRRPCPAFEGGGDEEEQDEEYDGTEGHLTYTYT